MNVWLRISASCVIIFRLFGRLEIQNRNCEVHLGSDSDLSLVTIKRMAMTL